MIIDSLTELFKRDLNKVITEVELYSNETNLWLLDANISNSAGNLCLHLVGNLNHFIGTNLGNTGYVWQRELEFSSKHIPRAELIRQVKETISIVEETLKEIPTSDLEKEYTHRVFDKPTTTGYFLMHLVMHLSYHLGQINYHRRLLDKQ